MQHQQTGFRRDGRRIHDWQHWVAANRSLIDKIPLPADVVAKRQEFDYLLQHGYNRAGWWNEQPWFEVGQLKEPEKALFWALLESYVAAFYPRFDQTRELEILARSFRPAGSEAKPG